MINPTDPAIPEPTEPGATPPDREGVGENLIAVVLDGDYEPVRAFPSADEARAWIASQPVPEEFDLTLAVRFAATTPAPAPAHAYQLPGINPDSTVSTTVAFASSVPAPVTGEVERIMVLVEEYGHVFWRAEEHQCDDPAKEVSDAIELIRLAVTALARPSEIARAALTAAVGDGRISSAEREAAIDRVLESIDRVGWNGDGGFAHSPSHDLTLIRGGA